MFIIFRQRLLRVGERSFKGTNLTTKAHHPMIEKVQSLMNNKPAQKEPETHVDGKGEVPTASSIPSAMDQHHGRTRLQREAQKVRVDTAGGSDDGPVSAASPATPDAPEGEQRSREANPPPPPGESMLEQLSVVPQWTGIDLRPSPSLGGDRDREESCRDELRGVLRDLHNYR